MIKAAVIRRGIGVGRGFHTSGTGAPQPGEVIDYSTALVKINEDGSADVSTALMDHGGGTLDAIAKIVAEELGHCGGDTWGYCSLQYGLHGV